MADNFSESIKCPLNADEKLDVSKGDFFFELKGNNSCEAYTKQREIFWQRA